MAESGEKQLECGWEVKGWKYESFIYKYHLKNISNLKIYITKKFKIN